MNKDIIEKAREAIANKYDRVDLYYIYIAKVDLDVVLSPYESLLWSDTRRAILEHRGFKVVDVITTKTERGMHTIINYLSYVKYSEEALNFIQLLLGDDIVRYKINKRRIERGISREKANILFSRILRRFPKEESRIETALRREIEEI